MSEFYDYFFHSTPTPCARMGCEVPAALRVDDKINLCGKHYKEHVG